MRKTIYHTFKIYSLIIICLVVSCNDDFVDVASPDENSEDFFNSEEDYQNALIGAYDLLQSTYLNVMVGEIASDNTIAGGESASDTPGIQEIDKMEHTPVNAQLRSIWSWMFAGVNRANYILEFQDKTDFEGKNGVIAQARFLRAYYYFELVKWFGDVPLSIDRRILFGEQFEIDRTPKEEVYAAIETDLQFAADNLPLRQAETGRVTRGAAQSLLGKVFLYQNKFSEATTVLDEVINSGTYQLVEDYASIFENEGENNEESVFEVQYTDVEGAEFPCLQCSEGNVAVGFNGIRNYDGPFFDSGFSFNLPVREVVDAFEEGDIREDVAILDIDQWVEDQNAIEDQEVTFDIGYPAGHTGYYNRKYIARKGDLNIGDAVLTNPNNYRAIRFADVLLMAAEAHNRNGNDTQALVYLNQVRNRAGLENSISTGDQLTNAIYQERRVELVGEGHRFFDLVRTGNGTDIEGFITGKHELFPIPSIEIELAGNRWDQNPGY